MADQPRFNPAVHVMMIWKYQDGTYGGSDTPLGTYGQHVVEHEVRVADLTEAEIMEWVISRLTPEPEA